MKRKNLDLSHTIFGLTSGELPTAVATVRVSGPLSKEVFKELFRPTDGKKEFRRGMYYGSVTTPYGTRIDSGIVLCFESPNSFTGEDSIEFQIHGSVGTVDLLQSTLHQMGCRLAERGEFSFRAFQNGRLSLSELENLGDLFLAKDETDLRAIYARRDPASRSLFDRMREKLIQQQAVFDTAVDFSDEYSNVTSSAESGLREIIRDCSLAIQRYSQLILGKTRPRLVIAGRPNAGKSSLFNALLSRSRALVNEEPGTTRDVIEDEISFSGSTWKLVDTAGIREGKSKAEIEGISLGKEFLSSAAAWILVIDRSTGATREDIDLIEAQGSKPMIIVWNKADLSQAADYRGLIPSGRLEFDVSCLDIESVSRLHDEISKFLASLSVKNESPLPTLTEANNLKKVLPILNELKKDLDERTVPPELLAEKNRQILQLVESCLGEVSVDDVLDRVFSEFCIGK